MNNSTDLESHFNDVVATTNILLSDIAKLQSEQYFIELMIQLKESELNSMREKASILRKAINNQAS